MFKSIESLPESGAHFLLVVPPRDAFGVEKVGERFVIETWKDQRSGQALVGIDGFDEGVLGSVASTHGDAARIAVIWIIEDRVYFGSRGGAGDDVEVSR
jgi:hypothetical protein